jgi:hypothetical protein
VRHLREYPHAVFRLRRRQRIEGPLHEFQSAAEISVQLAQISGARQSGNIAFPEVEHPLGRANGFFVVP